jgi:hypothetical protein
VLGLVVLTSGAILYYEHQHHHTPGGVAQHDPELRPEPPPSPEQQGRELRRVALEQCRGGDPQQCLDGLDQARALDPQGDRAPEVVSARSAAAAQLAPVPIPTPARSAIPSPSPSPTLSAKPQGPKPPHYTAPISTESSLPSSAPTPGASIDGSDSSDSLGASKPSKPARKAK